MREVECVMHVYLYYLVPYRPVTSSVPQSGMPVVPTGQELRFRGMDGQSPELISVTLQRTKTNGSSLKCYNQHSASMTVDWDRCILHNEARLFLLLSNFSYDNN